MTWYSSTGIRPVRLGASGPADGAATSPGALLRAVASRPVALSPTGASAAAESVDVPGLGEDSPLEHAAISGRRRASTRRSISDLRGDKSDEGEYRSRIARGNASRMLLDRKPAFAAAVPITKAQRLPRARRHSLPEGPDRRASRAHACAA